MTVIVVGKWNGMLVNAVSLGTKGYTYYSSGTR